MRARERAHQVVMRTDYNSSSMIAFSCVSVYEGKGVSVRTNQERT